MRHIYNFKTFESTVEMSSDLKVFLDRNQISPDFVPHEDFYKYKWLLPKGKNKKWYYSKESNGIYQIPTSQKFIESVDEDLRESIQILHDMKIPTTPSCSGHFYNSKYYENIYENLLEECKDINSNGIQLIDPEDEGVFHLKDPLYKVPWSKEEFVERGIKHGHMGAIGIYDTSKKIIKKIRETQHNCSQIVESGDFFIYITNPKNEKELKESWSQFTESIKDIH